MTEDEAKTKWCPFVRYATQARHNGDTDNACNRYGHLDDPGDSGVADFFGDDASKVIRWNKCIGSACMAWRYTNKTPMHSRSRWIDSQDKTADEAHAEYLKDFPLEGRCGLAGA